MKHILPCDYSLCTKRRYLRKFVTVSKNRSPIVILKLEYKTIEHYEYDYFFVEDLRGWWAVFINPNYAIEIDKTPKPS